MKRIVILGGGVIGLCAAYYAARRGHAVTVLEGRAEDFPGCSFGNAGMVVPSHFVPLAAPGAVALGLKWMFNPESPFWVKPRLDRELFDWGWKFWRASNAAQAARAAPLLRDLHLASRALFQELDTLTQGSFGLQQRGLLMLCKTARTLEEEGTAAAHARQLGVPAEVLDAGQTAALEPGIRMEVAGSVYFPKDCHLDPGRFMTVLKGLARAQGADLRYNEAVTGWETRGREVLSARTASGEFRADAFVLCGGSWSARAARQLGLNLPLQAGKGYSLTLPGPPRLPATCAILTEARVAVTPMGSSLRFGGTMEIAGLNEEVNPVRVRGIIQSAGRYYPEFTPDRFAGIAPWSGLRPCPPDGLPYLGRPARYPNLCIAAGHAMMGLSLGPITGELVARLLSDEPPGHPLELLDPDRYS